MPKYLRTLAVVLFVLAAAYILVLIPRPPSGPKTPDVPEKIQRFSLTRPAHSITMESMETGWRVTSPVNVPANEGSVVSFLAGLRSLTLEKVISHRPESHALYRLDNAQGILLKVWGEGAQEPQGWIIGKDSPTGGNVFVRLETGSEVYLAKGLSRAYAEADLHAWRETRLLPLPADEAVQAVEVRRGKTSLRVERSSTSWTVNGKPANSEIVDERVNSLRYVSADEFVDPPESVALLAEKRNLPSREIVVILSSGKNHVLRVLKEIQGDSPRTLFQRDEDPHLFSLSQPVVWLTLTEKELLPN
ncbi:MAG: DUF4340 domain-containing protein [Elusimicrobia bacterium]|jgi:hypothetical protein|nr:DUF4340 domain-containing protein [Elusimicrobiota bacterium]